MLSGGAHRNNVGVAMAVLPADDCGLSRRAPRQENVRGHDEANAASIDMKLTVHDLITWNLPNIHRQSDHTLTLLPNRRRAEAASFLTQVNVRNAGSSVNSLQSTAVINGLSA